MSVLINFFCIMQDYVSQYLIRYIFYFQMLITGVFNEILDQFIKINFHNYFFTLPKNDFI